MPSALEKLVKILRLETDTGCQDRAVIGGLRSFGQNWLPEAHAQARKPEHHILAEELVDLLNRYAAIPTPDERQSMIKYMVGRITGRIPMPPEWQARLAEHMDETERRPAPAVEQAEAEPPAPRPEVGRDTWSEPPRPAPVDAVSTPKPGARPADAPEIRPADEMPLPAPGAETGTGQPDFLAEALDIEVRPAIEPPRATRPQRRRRGERNPQREAEFFRELERPVTDMEGVGPKIGEKLAALGLHTVRDWLYFFPRRYDDYSRMLPLNRLQPGLVVTVIGTVRHLAAIKGRKGLDVLNVTIEDGTGSLTASFFNQLYLRNTLEIGSRVVFSGKTGLYGGKITMDNPEWEFVEQDALHTRGIVPVYPLTKGLGAHSMRRLTRKVTDRYLPHVPDFLPEAVLERVDLADLSWALRQMHLPESEEALGHARRRVAFDELLLLQLAVLANRREYQSAPGAAMPVPDDWLDGLRGALPFALTGAQERAIQAIRADMARPVPMNRLLQGDVGSGKTVVATAAMLLAVANGYQAAVMAPTSILAEQHFRGMSSVIQSLPGGQNIHIRLLTGATPAQERAEILWGLGEGSVHIVVGTHALIQEDVNYQRLGMAVIDEQHRFGVEQRARLRSKGFNPHLLVMTATPIPRTLALTMYADLDLSILDEMPPGRTPVQTRAMFPKERERIYRFVDSQVEKSRQAFVIYPLVEASERESMADVRSAVQEFDRLQQDVFPTRRLGLVHGRLSAAQKEAVMAAFGRGELDILVSTTVIEVGIDIPNASVIVVEGANRFGLAQLHQLRGRVGRGQHESYCLLIPEEGEVNNARLKVMEETSDGFRLAQMDWEMRGAGDLLGTQQSGHAVRMGHFMSVELVELAQVEARTIYEEDPYLTRPEHLALREKLGREFAPDHMADVS